MAKEGVLEGVVERFVKRFEIGIRKTIKFRADERGNNGIELRMLGFKAEKKQGLADIPDGDYAVAIFVEEVDSSELQRIEARATKAETG